MFIQPSTIQNTPIHVCVHIHMHIVSLFEKIVNVQKDKTNDAKHSVDDENGNKHC